ncbi:D-alanyl-D-alanine carboxypeptidase [Kitasatospora xanthocidica]|uniref:D-alanyl-D-alanine carboxypeptidase/D-alanyl-D-alanine endopeptidase n=1 Tax=Kitasatospora xanthocidica TaxID=83382 RepID=UPI00167BE8A1|nr:D-alanyl-D-alanine carboxypeptidase/D-alanyl-D-alanine-endopeptidase [Kitasatospora xanthocidica]GHF84572.1 D-alanyl-D-alanine carboxypeptidase [Kitasatospora xanthocidica]
MGAGGGAARRRRGTAAGLFGAALLVAGTVLTSGGAYAQPSPPPGGHSAGQGEDEDRDGQGGQGGHEGKKGEHGKNGPKAGSGESPGTTPTRRSGAPAATPGAGGAASAARPAPAQGAVLAAAEDGPQAAVPTTQGLQQALAAALADRGLGDVTFAVADAAGGQLLYGSGENTAATPASTTKLATSVAALSLIPGDTRLTTKVVRGAAPGTITLVGGGDPTLTALPVDQVQIGGQPADADTAPASLEALARQTADTLTAAGTSSVKLDYDLSMYAGNPRHKNHDGENIALVVPLMVDEAKVDPKSRADAPARVTDPALAAAEAFAGLLKARGITVEGGAKPTEAPAAADAPVLGRVDSPTLGRLVERLLTTSDNQLAEAIARQVALAAHQPASFEGAAAAVTQELVRLGVPMGDVVLNDGSGLHRDNLIPPVVLVRLLSLAASEQHPALRPVLTGLPVAGFTGTLGKRYGSASGAAAAAGLIRAKTGTLSGVNTLAGTVVDADGRLLAFAVMTRTPDTAPADTARAAMDRIAARLATCGCH